MHSLNKDWRRRNIMYDPRQYNFESFYTSAHQKKEMKHSFGDELLSNLHLLPDPLKKNLADSIITTETTQKTECRTTNKQFLNTMLDPEPPKMEKNTNQNHIHTQTFGSITNFFSGVLNVISGAMANWRPKSPVQYYDCFDDIQGAPLPWHSSNNEVQNKSAQEIDLNLKSDMNIDCKTAVAQCENKLNKVRWLLTTKPIETPKSRPRRPKKAFIEAGSVEESFEDAFTPEDFISVSNNKSVECYSPFQIHNEELSETAAAKVKIEKIINENTDIIKTVPEDIVKSEEIDKQGDETMKEVIETKLVENQEKEGEKSSKEELISSCEDKLSKLKALLQEKRKKNTIMTPAPASNTETVVMSNETHKKPPKPHDKTKDKRYKNPCRTTDKRKKSRMRKSIQDDLVFAQEMNGEDLSSVENSPLANSDRLSDTAHPLKFMDPKHSPVEYFDEVSGRFRSTSTTESEDSFQIVFNDSPKETRMRRVSDCDSEDSFIVFEDSPDSCYTSNDVFGESEESGSEYTDSESELSDTDDIQVTKLSHTLSRTLSDLTDSSLYEDNVDEVDCAVRSVCDEIPSQEIAEVCEVPEEEVEQKSTGLLLNEERKQQKRLLPPKSVRFSAQPPQVHVLRVWAFAARQARAGHWERCALDRDRFKRRIADVDMAVSWVLKPQHRSRVMFQRFMPWWNAQRRKELAEKKEREQRLKEEQQKEAERLEQERLEPQNKDGNDTDTTTDNLTSDEQQKQINESENNDIKNDDTQIVNDKLNDLNKLNDNESSDNLGKDKEQKQLNKNKGNDLKNKDKKVIGNHKLNGLKCNGFVKNKVNNKSQLNDVTEIIDKNDFTTKLRSEGLSST